MKTLATLLAGAILASAAPAFAESHAPACAQRAGVSCARADRTDSGGGNTATIVQDGDSNALRLQQRGSDLNANLTQNGDDNRLKLKQFGDGETATIVQNGGEHTTVIQGSPGNGDPRRVGMQRHLD